MIIKKIKLENIRSHLNNEINFEAGKTLLAGNIGSGKSTILLGIDFALFGLSKGVLSGGALLRNGEDSGKVRLEFEIDNNEVVIERRLKRTSSGISQDSGSISVNGAFVEKSAVELKQAVLELLNYPQELLSKGKGLIYRYTVYTPQEEMKWILLSSVEERLNTLRRVFGIDKYKRIKESSGLLLRLLKEKKKELAARTEGLEDKKKEKSAKEFEKAELVKELENLKPEHEDAVNNFKRIKERIKRVEEKRELRNSFVKTLEVKEAGIGHKKSSLERNKRERERLGNEILSLGEEVKGFAECDYINEIKKLELGIKKKELELRKVVDKLAELNAGKNHAKSIILGIEKLDICPVCSQRVNAEHKHKITLDENGKIAGLEAEFNVLNNAKEGLEKGLEEDKSYLTKYQGLERKQELLKFKVKSISEKKQGVLRLEEEEKEELAILGNLNSEIDELRKKINELGVGDYDNLRVELEQAGEKERGLAVKKNGLERDLNHLNALIAELEKELKTKQELRKGLEKLSGLHAWVDEFFINMISVMEKKIMTKLHGDFDALFQKWFIMLVGGEGLKIALDNEFSPRILQDGYDMEYENLSGGEKTAAALAYRLALNQVINKLISNIKTRDLLILDEPTDGFSDEQLDRMKNVLDELNIKQVLIVSHEEKIESFVDNILRLDKNEHVSRVN